MPAISMFYGIIIRMMFMDSQQHHLPHLHLEYQGMSAVVSLPVNCLREIFPRRSSGWFRPGLPFMKMN
uniref:DUF4160 domain-containing protein n=1 Tax=Candidatus Kentrum sp. LPFa TaxID=2126335 RepID=A0A450XA84_9GAMM|nr:MAG: protein of unknown function (DUF4160) [Candidatus Kentron sp. LPFa]VFK26110.1 MAG: protein of unknown function (DUF4160) [Candidatus Kentron sp. LPFa]